jgi:hypothetical protein
MTNLLYNHLSKLPASLDVFQAQQIKKMFKSNISDNADDFFNKLFKDSCSDDDSNSVFYYLCKNNTEVLGLLLAEYDSLSAKEALAQTPSWPLDEVFFGEGPHEGTTPLFWLTRTKEGIALLNEHFDHFRPFITSRGLDQVCTGEEPHVDTTPWFWLAALLEGQNLLTYRFDSFAELLTTDARALYLELYGLEDVPIFFRLASHNSESQPNKDESAYSLQAGSSMGI